MLGTAVIVLVGFAILKPSGRADTTPDGDVERLKATLRDLEKQVASLRQSAPVPTQPDARLAELEEENRTLREAVELRSDVERNLRHRIEELQQLRPVPKPAPPAARPVEGDPQTLALRPFLVDISAHSTRVPGLLVAPRFAVTRLAPIRKATRFSVEYSTGTGRTACNAVLYAADSVNGLALLNLQPMTPLKGITLVPQLGARDGADVFFVEQRHGADGLVYERKVGKVRQSSVIVDGIECIEALIPNGLWAGGSPLFLGDGRVLGLICGPGTAPATVAAVPAARIAILLARKDDPLYRVIGTMDEHELKSSPTFNYDRESAFKVGPDIQQMILVRDTGQLVCLEPKQNGVLVVSPATRAVSKSLFTGTDPTWVSAPPGQRKFWVSNSASKNLVRVDPGLASPVDLTIRLSFPPRRFVTTMSAIFAESSMSGNLYVITLHDRKEHQIQARFGHSIVYNARAGRLVGSAGGLGTSSVDVDKVLSYVRDLAKLKPMDRGNRQKLAAEFEKAIVHHQPAPGQVFRSGRFSMNQAFFDEGARRFYSHSVVFEGNRLDAIIVNLTPQGSERYSEGALRALTSKFPDISGVMAASPDGKWFATGLHLYHAENFTVKSELPVPTPFAVFSADSRTLYTYDSWNGYIVPVQME